MSDVFPAERATGTTSARLEGSANAPHKILFASLVGTTIELFDFYVYAAAAVLVFPTLFFPTHDAAAARLASLSTFGVAFLARPIGAAWFGHHGDRLGRKGSLVVSLGAMGLSTVAIGMLPTYRSVGFVAPLLLVLCRFGQGLGLGGEWGGALLLAIENAPPRRREWYGMFPQLGAPIGFALSSGVFLFLSSVLDERSMIAFGWRLPFLASGVLVAVGFYVRSTLTETPVFRAVLQRREAVRLPLLSVVRDHARALLAGILTCLATFVLFYVMTVFALSWATGPLGYGRRAFLTMQLLDVLFFALTIPISALLAARGRRRFMLAVTVAIGVFGLIFSRIFTAGPTGAFLTMALGFALTGLSYGPLGTIVAELFPARVRYTGSSLVFSFGAILGASVAPYATTWLAERRGLAYVGYYLSAVALLTILGLAGIRSTKDDELARLQAAPR